MAGMVFRLVKTKIPANCKYQRGFFINLRSKVSTVGHGSHHRLSGYRPMSYLTNCCHYCNWAKEHWLREHCNFAMADYSCSGFGFGTTAGCSVLAGCNYPGSGFDKMETVGCSRFCHHCLPKAYSYHVNFAGDERNSRCCC